MKNEVKAAEYSIRNGSILWQIQTSIIVIPEHFWLALTVCRYSHFKFRDLENVGQGHDGQHSQWHHSIANI